MVSGRIHGFRTHCRPLVKVRDRETLEGIIRKHIIDDTVIFSDSWAAYNGLRLIPGVTHYKVNHKTNFVAWEPVQRSRTEQEAIVREAQEHMFDDDDVAEEADELGHEWTVKVHTNKIERAWLEVKSGLGGQPICLMRRNVNVEFWRYNNLRGVMNMNLRRERVLRTIARHQTNLVGLKQQSFELFPPF